MQYITPRLTHQAVGRVDILAFDVMLKCMKKQMGIETIFLVSFSALLILSACQRAQTTELPLATQTSTAITEPSAYPSPIETERIEATSLTYPGPEVTAATSVAYPGPETLPFVDSTAQAYPQPGGDGVPLVIATPSATLQGAYPQPEGTQEPYPGPGSGQPLVTPGGFAQPTNALGEPTEESTPTPTTTPTLGLLRTELVASDPKSFRLAGGEYQLVEFFAFWSPESQSMAPVMNVLEQRYSDRMRFVYLDIDDPANSLFKTLLANRLPPLFFLLDGSGNIMHEWQGYIELDAFETTIAELVQ